MGIQYDCAIVNAALSACSRGNFSLIVMLHIASYTFDTLESYLKRDVLSGLFCVAFLALQYLPLI